MRKIIIYLLLLLPSVPLFAQNSEDNLLDENEPTNFHPIFKSLDEMVGKNIQFAIVDYNKQIDYVFVKRGKRFVNFKDIALPYMRYQTYYVNDVITANEGKRYIQILDRKKNKTFFLYSPDSTKIFNMLYDYDELQRMKQYVKEHFVYRKVEYGEHPTSKPYDYLPYVEVGLSGVDVFTKKYEDGFILAFYYFTDNGTRTIEYNQIDTYADRFLSKEGLQEKEIEYHEQQRIQSDKLIENTNKYGYKIAAAIYKGGVWTEETIEELIEFIGVEETEYVVSGEVHIGMDKSLCELSWGKPDKINKTTYSFGVREQWVYTQKNAYLYFEDGVLTAFSENE